MFDHCILNFNIKALRMLLSCSSVYTESSYRIQIVFIKPRSPRNAFTKSSALRFKMRVMETGLKHKKKKVDCLTGVYRSHFFCISVCTSGLSAVFGRGE